MIRSALHLVGVAALVLLGLMALGWLPFLAFLILGPMPTP